MLSREANQVYWTGRYLERAENLCRFIYVNLHYMMDMDIGDDHSWMALVQATGDQKAFLDRYSQTDETSVMKFLTFDTENLNSMISCVRMARENAKSLRSTLSSTMWEDINGIYWHTINHSKKKSQSINTEKFYSEFQKLYLQFLGSYHATMTRNEAWHFLKAGIMMERADKSARILDVKYFASLDYKAKSGNIFDSLMWRALLKSVSALHMYRREFAHVNAQGVIDFLVGNPKFPRSMAFCIQEMKESLAAISFEVDPNEAEALTAALSKLIASIQKFNTESTADVGIHDFIDSFQGALNQIDREIFELYFKVKQYEPTGNLSQMSQRQIQIQS